VRRKHTGTLKMENLKALEGMGHLVSKSDVVRTLTRYYGASKKGASRIYHRHISKHLGRKL